MTNLFEFHSYKTFILATLEALPKKGRGEFQRLSKTLKVHPTLISQIFNGPRNLSLEQATLTAEFLGLSEPETEYFLALVQLERAGNEKLRRILKTQMDRLKKNAQKIQTRLPKSEVLTEDKKSTFYSNWYYSAVRLCTSLPNTHDIDSISKHLLLQKNTVRKIIDFLVSTGLCITKEGKYYPGIQHTHLPAESPLIARHHSNWRIQALKQMDRSSEDNFFFTAPLSIASKNISEAKKIIHDAIQKVGALVEKDDPDTVACLNIDWFKVT